MKKSFFAVKIPVFSASLSILHAWAGRLSTADVANIDNNRSNQIAMYIAREQGKLNTVNIAPAFATMDGAGPGFWPTRGTTKPFSMSAMLAKWRTAPSQEKSGNWAAVMGLVHAGNSDSLYRAGMKSQL